MGDHHIRLELVLGKWSLNEGVDLSRASEQDKGGLGDLLEGREFSREERIVLGRNEFHVSLEQIMTNYRFGNRINRKGNAKIYLP